MPLLALHCDPTNRKQFTKSVSVVACHGTWARIFDAPWKWKAAYHTACQAFFLLVNQRPGQLKGNHLFHKRQKMLSKTSQGDPTWCSYLKNLFYVYWISSGLRFVYIFFFLPSLQAIQFFFLFWMFSSRSRVTCLVAGWGIHIFFLLCHISLIVRTDWIFL